MTNSANEDVAFKDELIGLIPQLRAFGRSLCHNPIEADDLAQDALAKAWASKASYQPGTNLKAWTFMILRNQFYSNKRRSWRSTELDQETAEQTLVAITSADGSLQLDELRRALTLLPDEQREALILIGAGGLSYDEAADICGAAVGTIKSRVSRAREKLSNLFEEGGLARDGMSPSAAMADIFRQLDVCRFGRCA